MKNILLFTSFVLFNFTYSQVKIGDKLEEGILFFVDDTGKHGLIADFKDEKKMNWNRAVKTCESKGDGWRLPTKDELDKLYHKRDLIGEYKKFYYWSSTLDEDNKPWGQNFANGVPEVSQVKIIPIYVRCVKSF